MQINEVEVLIQNAYASSQFFLFNPSVENGLRLDEALTKLNYEISTIDPTGRLDEKSSEITNFLLQCKQLLTNENATLSTRSKLYLIFYNLALYNINIRKFLSEELQLCGPIVNCLQLSISAQLGPQNLIDILRLLQILTYEKFVATGSWTTELLVFLVNDILKTDVTETIETNSKAQIDHPLPYCMTILCNLVSRSKIICNKLKKTGNFKHLCRRLLDYLQNNSRTVVVCSLVLIGYLDEKTRDTIFSPQNIAQSFLCIFNVLGSSDSLMTVHIAVDLLKKLVISESAFGLCTLTTTAKNFTSYQFFDKSMQRIGNLLTNFDPRTEESVKIYDLLLSFCKIPDLKKAVCKAIIETPKSEKRLITPCFSITKTAFLTFEESIRPEIPLKALQLLTYIIAEAIENGIKINELIPTNKLCLLIETSIKCVIETKSNFVIFQCTQITEGLRLAEIVANDEEIRSDLLDVINASLCGHINESQLISNPIVSFFNKLRSSTSLQFFSDDLPEWCLAGVSIPLQLLRLLATLKDYSKMHKDLYWRSLKDERIIPFIAFAISRGNYQIVHEALVLFNHCAQIQDFQTKLLSDLVAICTLEMKAHSNEINKKSFTSLQKTDSSCEIFEDYLSNNNLLNERENFKQIDELLNKMKEGLDLKDIRTSQLICAFEKKVAMHESREQELEQLIALKEQALSQSERFRTIYQNRKNNEEVTNLRLLLSDLEKKLNESNDKIMSINVENKELIQKITELEESFGLERLKHKNQVEILEHEKNILADENEKERELHTVLRKRFDEMTEKFNLATKTIFEKQQELEQTINFVADANKKAAKIQINLDEANTELMNLKKKSDLQSTEIENQQKEIEDLKIENKKLLEIKLKMVQMLKD